MSKYQQSYRRMLVDMHIPDWDPAFLSRYDPASRHRLPVRFTEMSEKPLQFAYGARSARGGVADDREQVGFIPSLFLAERRGGIILLNHSGRQSTKKLNAYHGRLERHRL